MAAINTGDYFGTEYTFNNGVGTPTNTPTRTYAGPASPSYGNPLPTVQNYTPQVNSAINGGTALQSYKNSPLYQNADSAMKARIDRSAQVHPADFEANWQQWAQGQQAANLYPGVTPEMQALRTSLGDWLNQNFNATPPAYGGQLSVDWNPLQQMAQDTALQGIQQSMGFVRDASDTIHGLIGKGDNISAQVFPWLQQAFSAAQSGGQQGLDWLNMGKGTLQELMKNGGAPNIQNALNAIQQQGMINVNDQLAQIQEKYAQGGLGRGSDIAGALATGASRGIADINANQAQLQAQILNSAADRRLGATGLVPQFANAASSIDFNMASTMGNLADSYLNSLVSPYQVQAGLASQLPGLASTTSGIYSNAANSFTSQAALDINRQQGNIQNQYQDFVRSTTPEFLQAALQFGGNYAPVPQANNTGGGVWGALGQIGSSVLSKLLSTREAKENIKPLEARTLTKKLKTLPIYTWNYKGDATPHLGPIAEEFRDTFGVGDGKTLHPVDLFGVMLGAVKGMTESYA